MTNILDQMARRESPFRPHSVTDFFVLQLARKLKDVEHLHTYLTLAGRYSEEQLLQAFRRAAERSKQGAVSAEYFQEEVNRVS